MMQLNEREVTAEILQRELSGLDRTTLIELACLYILKDHMAKDAPQKQTQDVAPQGYSYAPAPEPRNAQFNLVGLYGNSEFLQAIEGRDAANVWKIMDDLMDTLMVVNKRVYDSVMRKIERA